MPRAETAAAPSAGAPPVRQLEPYQGQPPSKPHHQTKAAPPAQARPPAGQKVHRAVSADWNSSAPALLAEGKHAMLSYQWDEQARVSKTRKALHRRSVKTWMDVDGGMSGDIFESMAQGVEGAACIVSFLTQRYQDSDNCPAARGVYAPLAFPAVNRVCMALLHGRAVLHGRNDSPAAAFLVHNLLGKTLLELLVPVSPH
jgi:hypothetical protein